MINLKQFVVLFCAAGFMASCSSVTKISSAKSIDITPSIVQKPTVADLDVKEAKVSGISSSNATLISIETIKNQAVANALKSVNADILVEPQFELLVFQLLTRILDL